MFEQGVLCPLRRSLYFVYGGGGDDDKRQRREIGNTLQEVTNPMERTQNIAHLETPLS
jgi:hypothetical protein